MASEGGLRELYAGFVPILAKQIPCRFFFSLTGGFRVQRERRRSSSGLRVLRLIHSHIKRYRRCRSILGQRARARAGQQAHLARTEGATLDYGADGDHARLWYHGCEYLSAPFVSLTHEESSWYPEQTQLTGLSLSARAGFRRCDPVAARRHPPLVSSPVLASLKENPRCDHD